MVTLSTTNNTHRNKKNMVQQAENLPPSSETQRARLQPRQRSMMMERMRKVKEIQAIFDDWTLPRTRLSPMFYQS